MTLQPTTPSALLLKQMFGKPIALINLIATSVFISILWFLIFELPELIPIPTYQIPTIPCDYQAIAGVLFFMTIILRKPYMLLRHPRKTTWLFVAGITYRQRQLACLYFVKSKMFECIVFLGAFFFVRYILLFIFDHHITIIGLLIPEVPLFLLLGVLYILSKRIVYSLPFSRKEYLSINDYSSGSIVNHNIKSGFISFARMFASGSKKPVHTVIIRMVIYVLRKDQWGTLFLQLAGIIVSIVVAVLLPWSTELLVRVILLAAPVLLMSEHREAIINSILKLYECPYYYFTSKEIIKAGIYICSLVCIPYVIIYLIRQSAFLSHFDAVAFTSFMLSIIALCLVMGRSFYESGRLGGEKKGLTFSYSFPVIMCSLMPWIGIVFSVILIYSNVNRMHKGEK